MKSFDVLTSEDTQRFAQMHRAAPSAIDVVGPRVREILDDIRARGDIALRHWTQVLDGYDATPLLVPQQELTEAWESTPRDLQRVLTEAAARIRAFHQMGLDQSWSLETEPGTWLGYQVTPVDRVGVYVPGGTASYPSTVLMNVIPAQVAGVREVALCSPGGPDGRVGPMVLAAAAMLGVTEVYRIGGAQAVGALAYGTQSIRPVDTLTGPGNAYVTRAKREVFGVVGIDMLAGPSEVMVVADDTADPAWVAADLIAQAEHDEMAAALLVTTSPTIRSEVDAALVEQLATLPRAATARASLAQHGMLVLVDSLERAAELVNLVAPEHLELVVDDPHALLASIRHAGSIFLGPSSAEAFGDYLAGPNHTLPTSGTARFSSGLSVRDFQKRSSVIQLSPSLSRTLAPAVAKLARAEGLEGHARAAEVRA